MNKIVGKEDGISVGMELSVVKIVGCEVTVGDCEGVLEGSCVGGAVGTTLKLGFSEGALDLLGAIEGAITGAIEGDEVVSLPKFEGAGEQEGCCEGSVDIVGYIEGLLLKLPLPLPFDPPLFPLLLVPLPLLLLPSSPHATTDFDDFELLLLLLLLVPFPLLFDSNMMLWKFRLFATLERRSARPSLFSESSVPLILCALLAKAF